MSTRRLELSPARLERWWATFHDEHPNVTWEVLGDEIVLSSSDGTRATFRGWFPPERGDDAIAALTWMPRVLGLVLIRRGGYSIGAASGGELTAHKTGTRYVQARTAAGGWSQQRFARRRENQANELVESVRGHVRRIVLPALAADAGLVLAGDELLARQVLEDRALTALADLPRREFWDIPDPRLAVLKDVLKRAATISATVINP